MPPSVASQVLPCDPLGHRKLLFASIVFFAAVNVLARVVMKDVANCDTHCELRSSGNQQIVERMRRLEQFQGASGSVF